MNKEDQDYFKIDAISHSRLCALDPSMGGSPKKFLDFINEDIEKEENVSMERGSLIHKYVEDRDSFQVLEIDKPSEKLGEVADNIIQGLLKYNNGKIPSKIESEDESLNNLILNTCREIGWNPKWGNDAIIKNAAKPEVKSYIKLMLDIESTGKIPMTKATKIIVEKCTQSLENHSKVSACLFANEIPEGVTIYKEKAIQWQMQLEESDVIFDCKAKIDNFELDFTNKIVRLKDLKSGAFSISNFDSTFKYRRIYRQLAWYKKAITEYCKQNNIDILYWEWEFYIIAVETKDEFRSAIFTVPQSWIFKGISEYNDLLNRFIFHKKNGFNMLMEEIQNNGYMILKDPE